VRLDHLLSKEHFLPVVFGLLVRGQYIGECPVLVAHGWNVDYSARSDGLYEYCFGVESVDGLVVSGTLLGV
jgi:hypothetical protein